MFAVPPPVLSERPSAGPLVPVRPRAICPTFTHIAMVADSSEMLEITLYPWT